VLTGVNFVENEFLKVEVTGRGTVQLTDKSTGCVYENINSFEDSGDVGDEYNYSYPDRDEWCRSDQFIPRITIEERGPLRARLRLEHRMIVPKEASADGKSRSVEKVELLIVTTFSLTRLSKLWNRTQRLHLLL